MMRIYKRAFIDTLPVLAGYLVLGFGFGIILKSKGYSVMLALAMSGLIYAGSMQYVALSLISSGAPLLTIAVTTLMVNMRHLFYGISMVEKYRNAGILKPYLIFALTDETYSLVCTDKGDILEKDKKRYYFLVSVMNQSYWIIGSVAGALIGSILQFNSEGIDFALTALFITVFLEQWLTTKKHIPALIGLIATSGCLLIFNKEKFLIPSMIVIVLLLSIYDLYYRKKEVKQNG